MSFRTSLGSDHSVVSGTHDDINTPPMHHPSCHLCMTVNLISIHHNCSLRSRLKLTPFVVGCAGAGELIGLSSHQPMALVCYAINMLLLGCLPKCLQFLYGLGSLHASSVLSRHSTASQRSSGSSHAHDLVHPLHGLHCGVVHISSSTG